MMSDKHVPTLSEIVDMLQARIDWLRENDIEGDEASILERARREVSQYGQEQYPGIATIDPPDVPTLVPIDD